MQWFKGTITSNWDEYLKLVVMYHYGIICDPLSDNPAHPTFLNARFKDTYLCYAMRYLNEMWVVYTAGIVAAITWK